MNESGLPAMLAYAVMVARDPAIAAEAAHDAAVAAAVVSPVEDPPLHWRLAVARAEVLRQLRARTVFIDTRPVIDPRAADPFDALVLGDRDTLALMRRPDLTLAQAARAMGCAEGEARTRLQRAERELADAAAVLAVLQDPEPACPTVAQVLGECDERGGMLTPDARARMWRHARTCGRCRSVWVPERADARERLEIPETLPVPPALEARVDATLADAEESARFGARLGSLDDGGFPVPLDRADRDPMRWVRRGTILAGVSAALLLVALVVLGLTSR